MKITILSTAEYHPVNAWLKKWVKKHKDTHEVELLRSKKELVGGDILFLISCAEIVSEKERHKYKNTLVIHASDLPKGRGWSPHIWEIINGEEKITLSLLEAEDKVDSGDIWRKVSIDIPNTALFDEINTLVFKAELELMDFAVENVNKVKPINQAGIDIKPWPKRSPKDSEIDINKTIEEQFNLIRVCDTDRFPAFFYKNGKKFELKVEAADE